MKIKLTGLMITKNSDAILDESLASLKKLTDEIIIVDSRSTDNTLRIARKYRARIYVSDEEDLGKKRALGFKKAKNNWILTIDADEVIPPSLASEIKQVVASGKYDG
jgi:glycosyltransferase involved in cell wall biosynthesis